MRNRERRPASWTPTGINLCEQTHLCPIYAGGRLRANLNYKCTTGFRHSEERLPPPRAICKIQFAEDAAELRDAPQIRIEPNAGKYRVSVGRNHCSFQWFLLFQVTSNWNCCREGILVSRENCAFDSRSFATFGTNCAPFSFPWRLLWSNLHWNCGIMHKSQHTLSDDFTKLRWFSNYFRIEKCKGSVNV